MRVKTPLVVALAGLIAAAAAAQTVQGPTFRTGVDILAVDVTVVDGDGRPVSDLGTAEFTVKVDGQPRKIVSLEYIATPGGEQTAATPEPDPHYSTNEGPQGGRLILLVIDQNYLRLGTGRVLASTVGRLLDQLTAADRVGLLGIPAPGPAVEFTSDRNAIREALGKVRGTTPPLRSTYNLGMAEALMLADRVDPTERQSILSRECAEYQAGSQSRDLCEDHVDVEAAMIAGEVRSRTQQSVSAFHRVLSSLEAIDGPKAVIFVSEGLVLDLNGEDMRGIAQAAAESRTTIHVVMLDPPGFDASIADMPRTPFRDRQLNSEGLELMAGLARGGFYRDVGGGAGAFDRLQREMSGYYLLGVEPEARDRDGRQHRIEVEVRRRGTTVRARQEFLLEMNRGRRSEAELVSAALGSPIALNELPLRVASYAFQDHESAKVKVVISAEIDGPRPSGSEYTIGFALFEPDGRVVADKVERTKRDPSAPAGPVEHTGALLVEPGTYTFKMAVVDDAGRRGSVEHRIEAWKMAGEEFAVGDLLLANAPPDQTALRPGVVVRLDSGRLAAYTELYARDPSTLENVEVKVEVGEDESGPVLAGGVALVRPDTDGRRTAQALIPIDALPPGRYLARATIERAGQTVGRLTRPFEVTRSTPAARVELPGATPAAPNPSAIAGLGGPFRREDMLTPDVLGFFVGALEQSRASAPASVKSALAAAKKGQLEGVWRQAFEAGDQVSARFLRGLELYAGGQFEQAATQFRSVVAEDGAFVPARFYLGAAYAAGGRDAEAGGLWARGVPPGAPAELYGLVGDTFLRQGNATQAILPLRDGVARFPEDDRLRRRLALAYLGAGQAAEGLNTIEPYLDRHPDDEQALFAALRTLYETLAAGQTAASASQDRTRFARYAKAYAATRGDQAGLVAKWAEALAGPSRVQER